MFDMGFLPDIRKILKHVPAKRQTLLFSATMPDDIRQLAQEILRTPVTVQVRCRRRRQARSRTRSTRSRSTSKPTLLLELLRHTDTESVLIFTRTKHRAKRLGEQLERAGYRAASLQGNLSQNQRQAALDGFRDGSYQILVATDIAARGIDVSRISHVINYDMPDTADAYTHRIGRTGRAEKTGDAFTFVTREDEVMVRSIERVLGKRWSGARCRVSIIRSRRRRATPSLPARRVDRSATGNRDNRFSPGPMRPRQPRGMGIRDPRRAGWPFGVPLPVAPPVHPPATTGRTNPTWIAEHRCSYDLHP